MKAVISRLSPGATTLIRRDHMHLLSIFHSYRIDLPPGKKRTLVETISLALEMHAKLEEEIFYPAMRKIDGGVVEKSVPEHNEMRRLIARLREMEPEDQGFDGTVMELMRDVMRPASRQDRCQRRTFIPGRDLGANERSGARGASRRTRTGAFTSNSCAACVQCHSQISACEKSARDQAGADGAAQDGRRGLSFCKTTDCRRASY